MAVKTPLQLFGGNFPIGVDNQRIATMKLWRERGANFLVRADLTGAAAGIVDFVGAAETNGFRCIVPFREAGRLPAAWWGSVAVAVNMDDEPDLEGHYWGVRPASGWPKNDKGESLRAWQTETSPDGRIFDMVGKFYRAVPGGPLIPTGATVAASAEAYAIQVKRARAAILPGTPVFGNMAGSLIGPTDKDGFYERHGAVLDWVGHDWYVVNRDPILPFKVRRYQHSWPGSRAAWLSAYAGGLPATAPWYDPRRKPAIAGIEAGWTREDKAGRWPIPEEIWAQVFGAIVQGCHGIYYFPQRIGNGYRPDAIEAALTDSGFVYSTAEKNAAAALADGIAAINARVTALSPYLCSDTWQPAPSPAEGVYTASWVIPTGQLTIRVNCNPVGAADLAPYEVQISEKPTHVPPPDPVADIRETAENALAAATAANSAAAWAARVSGEALKAATAANSAAAQAAGISVEAARASLNGTAAALDQASAALRKLAADLTKPAQ
jgi:hypothetical protein